MVQSLSTLVNGLTVSPNPLSPAKAGFLQAHAGSTAPDGWLVCDGSAVSRTTYAALFATISTTYGVGDGSTTFNLPDGGPLIETEDTKDLTFFDFTPMGTVAVNSLNHHRVGNRLIAEGCCTLSGSATVPSYFKLPTGLTVETAKLTASVSSLGVMGRIEDSTTQTPTYDEGETAVLFWDGTDDDRIYVGPNTHNSVFQKDALLNGSNRFWWRVSIPINEWVDQGSQLIKAFNDDVSGVAIGLIEGTPSALGVLKKNQVIEKIDPNTRTTNQSGLLPLTNLPDGLYRVTVGAQSVKGLSGDNSLIEPNVNGAVVDLGGQTWFIGLGSVSTATTGAVGFSSTRDIQFTGTAGISTFDIDLVISAGSSVDRVFYSLEKLENYEVITTEWD